MFDPKRDRTTSFAYKLSQQLHNGQTDKSGADYFRYHVRDVADRVYRAPRHQIEHLNVPIWSLVTIALLHDVLEDTPMTEDVLHGLFNEEIVDAVVALSKPRDLSYSDYINGQVGRNSLAVEVKIHDIHSNLNPERLHELDGTTQVRLVNKYTDALKNLYAHRV